MSMGHVLDKFGTSMDKVRTRLGQVLGKCGTSEGQVLDRTS